MGFAIRLAIGADRLVGWLTGVTQLRMFRLVFPSARNLASLT
jgi:hypothetical protein